MSQNPREFTISVDLKVYRLSTVKRCVYDLSAAWQIKITIDKGKAERALLTFVPTSPNSLCTEDSARTTLCRLLAEHDLREQVTAQTHAIKNLLLAQAFLPISLAYPDLDKKCWKDAVREKTLSE